MTTTNNKDIPPTNVADIDKATLELQAKIDADKKAREEKDKAKAESDALKLEGKKALLQSYIDGGASKDQVDALRKSMGLEGDGAQATPNQGTQEQKPEPDQMDANTPEPVNPDEEPVVPTVEDERTPEEKRVDEARDAYVKEYLKCKKIAKTKGTILNLFKSQEKKEEKYLSEEYVNLKKEYDEARIDMGNSLFNTKKAELEANGVRGQELIQKLKEYKATEILDKTIIEEGDKLVKAKAEGSPMNPKFWKQALNWYTKQPRWKKVAMSTAIFTGVSIATAGGATVSMFGVALGRYARGMISGVLSSGMAEVVDVVNKKKNEKWKTIQYIKESSLKDQFGSGAITQEEYEKGMASIERSDKKRKRNQAIVKLVVGIIAGAGFGYGSSHIGNIDSPDWFHKQPGVPKDSIPGLEKAEDSIINKPDIEADTTTNTAPAPDQTQITAPPTTPEVDKLDTGSVVEAEVGKGHGAIKTLEEFQEKLRVQYPEGSTDVPESVKHILNTKADRLAIEYGMFKPGDDAESAIMKIGSKFESDAEGNITFEQEGKTTLLEKGDDADVTNIYGGKMIDGDHSGRPQISTEHRDAGTSDFLKDHPQRDPEGVISDETISKPNSENTSEFIKDNPQKNPEGVLDTNAEKIIKPVTEPTPSILTPKIENGSGGASETIFPREGRYDLGEGKNSGPNFASNKEVVGNGFTTETPMTNEALAERDLEQQQLRDMETSSKSTSSTIENGPRIENIKADPRHVEDLDDIRDTFGRKEVVIDRPDVEKINGIENRAWNKAADHMFKVKNVEFDSYEGYEKEDELQRLLGNAEQKVEYVESLDKNAEVINMEYFRETPEWPTVNKIPAKYFFDFKDAKFIDGSNIPQEDLDKLVDGGILQKSVVTNPDEATVSTYSFTNREELERLSKTYREILPEKEIELGNDKPIGNETLEKYVGRMTKRVYEADDGTKFALKKNMDFNKPAGVSEGYETMRGERATRSTNMYNNGRVISPTYGAWQTRSDYSPNGRLANRAVENIIRWTH